MPHLLCTLMLATMLHSAGTAPAVGQEHNAQERAGVRVEFPGGTVNEYVELLRNVYGGSANIILTPGTDKFDMPTVQIQDVSVGIAVGLIERLATPSDDSPRQIASLYYGDTYTLRPYTARAAPSDKYVSRVESVAQVLDAGFTAEDILTAIEQVLDVMGDGYDEPKLRFHEATGLLIGWGHQDQMYAMESTVDELVSAASLRSSSSADDRKALDQQAQQISRLAEELEQARAEALRRNQDVILMQTKVDALTAELRRARNTIDVLEARCRNLRLQEEPAPSAH